MQSFPDSVPGMILSLISLVAGTVIGAAYVPLRQGARTGLRMSGAIAEARAATDWNIGPRIINAFKSSQPRTRSDGVEIGPYVAGAAIYLVVIGLYVRYAEIAATSLVLLAIVTYVASTWGLLQLRRRGVVDGRAVVDQILLGFAFAGLGIANGVVSFYAPDNAAARADYDMNGWAGASVDSMVAVTCLTIGTLLTAGVLLASIFFSFASVTSVHIAQRTFGRPFWTLLFWLGRWTTAKGTIVSVLIAGVLSLPLSAGWGADWIVDLLAFLQS